MVWFLQLCSNQWTVYLSWPLHSTSTHCSLLFHRKHWQLALAKRNMCHMWLQDWIDQWFLTSCLRHMEILYILWVCLQRLSMLITQSSNLEDSQKLAETNRDSHHNYFWNKEFLQWDLSKHFTAQDPSTSHFNPTGQSLSDLQGFRQTEYFLQIKDYDDSYWRLLIKIRLLVTKLVSKTIHFCLATLVTCSISAYANTLDRRVK